VDRHTSKALVGGLTLTAAVLIGASVHGAWWSRVLLTVVFTLGAWVALMTMRLAWHDGRESGRHARRRH
jgi:cytochrome c biogenesis protein CcdA